MIGSGRRMHVSGNDIKTEKNIKNRIKTGKSKKDRRRSNKKHNQKSNRKEKAMNKHQSNKISMIEGVHAYLTEHENVIENAAGIKSAAESLQVKITEIRSKENERLNVLKGKTLAKEAFRKHIVTQGLSFASKLFDLGKRSGNIELMTQSDYCRSDLKNIRDLELMLVLQTIKENAAANIEKLAVYGITQEKLDVFSSETVQFQESIDRKLTSVAIKISAGKTLTVLFREADQILKTLDKMVEEYHDSDNQFYLGYKSARSIKNLGLRHRPLEAVSQGSLISTPGSEQPKEKVISSGTTEQ